MSKTILDPKDRAERGRAVQARAIGQAPDAPATLLQEAWRDFVFADVWSRPGLDLRSRFFVALTGSVMAAAEPVIIESFVRGALSSGGITLAELREAALHLAVYAGWPRAIRLDNAVSRVAADLGLPPAKTPPLRAGPWDKEEGRKAGVAAFEKVVLGPPAPPNTPYFDAIPLFVFGEMWPREGLDQRARRWITLVCVCDGGAEVPIEAHLYAAMGTGDCTVDELQEFVLQYATQAGWPRGSLIQAVLNRLAKRIADGLGRTD